jgi:hypothetical protein
MQTNHGIPRTRNLPNAHGDCFAEMSTTGLDAIARKNVRFGELGDSAMALGQIAQARENPATATF